MRTLSSVALAFCTFGVAAHAATLTYTETVTASGSVNNVAFTNQLVTLSLTADPTTVTGANGGVFLTPSTTLTGTVANGSSFEIAGVEAFSNEMFSVGGLNDGALGDILDTSNAAFASYNLKSVFGPVSGSAESSLQTYVTTTGTFQLTALNSNASFQTVVSPTMPTAAATPEPSSFALLGTGLFGVAGLVRKRLA